MKELRSYENRENTAKLKEVEHFLQEQTQAERKLYADNLIQRNINSKRFKREQNKLCELTKEKVRQSCTHGLLIVTVTRGADCPYMPVLAPARSTHP